MFELVKVTMAGIERMIPKTMLQAMKSFGWKEVSGANPVVAEDKAPLASTVKKKEKKNAKIPQG